MITIGGQDYGTAAELAAELGPDVKPDTIWNWRRRDGLTTVTTRDEDGYLRTRSPLREAALIEARKRSTRRGRPRVFDPRQPLAA